MFHENQVIWQTIIKRLIFKGQGSTDRCVVALLDNECRNDASIKSWLGRGRKDFIKREKVIHVVFQVGEEERSLLEKGVEEGRNVADRRTYQIQDKKRSWTHCLVTPQQQRRIASSRRYHDVVVTMRSIVPVHSTFPYT